MPGVQRSPLGRWTPAPASIQSRFNSDTPQFNRAPIGFAGAPSSQQMARQPSFNLSEESRLHPQNEPRTLAPQSASLPDKRSGLVAPPAVQKSSLGSEIAPSTTAKGCWYLAAPLAARYQQPLGRFRDASAFVQARYEGPHPQAPSQNKAQAPLPKKESPLAANSHPDTAAVPQAQIPSAPERAAESASTFADEATGLVRAKAQAPQPDRSETPAFTQEQNATALVDQATRPVIQARSELIPDSAVDSTVPPPSSAPTLQARPTAPESIESPAEPGPENARDLQHRAQSPADHPPTSANSPAQSTDTQLPSTSLAARHQRPLGQWQAPKIAPIAETSGPVQAKAQTPQPLGPEASAATVQGRAAFDKVPADITSADFTAAPPVVQARSDSGTDSAADSTAAPPQPEAPLPPTGQARPAAPAETPVPKSVTALRPETAPAAPKAPTAGQPSSLPTLQARLTAPADAGAPTEPASASLPDPSLGLQRRTQPPADRPPTSANSPASTTDVKLPSTPLAARQQQPLGRRQDPSVDIVTVPVTETPGLAQAKAQTPQILASETSAAPVQRRLAVRELATEITPADTAAPPVIQARSEVTPDSEADPATLSPQAETVPASPVPQSAPTVQARLAAPASVETSTQKPAPRPESTPTVAPEAPLPAAEQSAPALQRRARSPAAPPSSPNLSGPVDAQAAPASPLAARHQRPLGRLQTPSINTVTAPTGETSELIQVKSPAPQPLNPKTSAAPVQRRADQVSAEVTPANTATPLVIQARAEVAPGSVTDPTAAPSKAGAAPSPSAPPSMPTVKARPDAATPTKSTPAPRPDAFPALPRRAQSPAVERSSTSDDSPAQSVDANLPSTPLAARYQRPLGRQAPSFKTPAVPAVEASESVQARTQAPQPLSPETSVAPIQRQATVDKTPAETVPTAPATPPTIQSRTELNPASGIEPPQPATARPPSAPTIQARPTVATDAVAIPESAASRPEITPATVSSQTLAQAAEQSDPVLQRRAQAPAARPSDGSISPVDAQAIPASLPSVPLAAKHQRPLGRLQTSSINTVTASIDKTSGLVQAKSQAPQPLSPETTAVPIQRQAAFGRTPTEITPIEQATSPAIQSHAEPATAAPYPAAKPPQADAPSSSVPPPQRTIQTRSAAPAETPNQESSAVPRPETAPAAATPPPSKAAEQPPSTPTVQARPDAAPDAETSTLDSASVARLETASAAAPEALNSAAEQTAPAAPEILSPVVERSAPALQRRTQQPIPDIRIESTLQSNVQRLVDPREIIDPSLETPTILPLIAHPPIPGQDQQFPLPMPGFSPTSLPSVQTPSNFLAEMPQGAGRPLNINQKLPLAWRSFAPLEWPQNQLSSALPALAAGLTTPLSSYQSLDSSPQVEDLVDQPAAPTDGNSTLPVTDVAQEAIQSLSEAWQSQFALAKAAGPVKNVATHSNAVQAAQSWQSQFALESAAAPSSNQDLALSQSSDRSSQTPLAPNAAQSADNPPPVPSPIQQSPKQITTAQIEQLARICYGQLRSQLSQAQEMQRGRMGGLLPWLDVVTYPLDQNANNASSLHSLEVEDVNSISLKIDPKVQALTGEVYALVTQRLKIDQERFSSSYLPGQ